MESGMEWLASPFFNNTTLTAASNLAQQTSTKNGFS
jgi:hypothetical protein